MKTKKPWGFFETLAENQECTVKIITMEKGKRLSLQRHRKRDEVWLIIDEGLTVEIGRKKKKAHAGQNFFVPKDALHRISAQKRARLLEVSFGKYSEDDIERLEDDYGRI